jgi:hypothetical protein
MTTGEDLQRVRLLLKKPPVALTHAEHIDLLTNVTETSCPICSGRKGFIDWCGFTIQCKSCKGSGLMLFYKGTQLN